MKHRSKTLYSVLGIAPDAHAEVVKAAYRALAKQYHPDGEGGGLNSSDKFIELQHAYEVLSDPSSRAAYDAMLFGENEAVDYSIADEDQEANIDPDDVWASKVAIHPEIESLYEILDGYSQALGNRFRLAVINGECEDNPALFASELDRVFFAKYFGDNPDVRLIARRLLTIGNRRAAKVLNKAVQKGKLRGANNISRLLGVFDRLLPPDLRILPEQDAARVETVAFDYIEKLRPDRVVPPPASVSSPGRFILGLSLSALVAVVLGGLLWLYGGSLNSLAGTATAPQETGQVPVVHAPDEPAKVKVDSAGAMDAAVPSKKEKLIYDRVVGEHEISRDVAIQPSEEVLVPSVTLRTEPPVPSRLDVSQPELPQSPDQSTRAQIEAWYQPGGQDAAVGGKRRVALVIGNASYRRIPWLENPDNDARAMAAALSRFGWEVKTVVDGTLSSMWLELLSFSKSLGKDVEVALVYYSGHAVEIDSTNFLLPVEIAKDSATIIRNSAVSATEVIDLLETNGVPTKILILDACRNNPLKDQSNQGLALVSAESGVFIAYSTSPGTVAADGDTSAENSPYTSALVKALKSPAQTIEETFRDVRSEVIRVTNGKQVPWESSSLTKSFSFADASIVRVIAAPSVAEDADVTAVAAEQKVKPADTGTAVADISAEGTDAGSEEIKQGYPVPKPRPRPIEVLMMAAVNMKIEPASPPPPDQTARHAAQPLEDSSIGVVIAPDITPGASEDTGSGKTSLARDLTDGEAESVPTIRTITASTVGEDLFWWPQELIFENAKVARRDGSPEQFPESDLSELLPGTSAAPTPAKARQPRLAVAEIVQPVSGKGDLVVVNRSEKSDLLFSASGVKKTVQDDN
jgi:curved DNA-binding protein CbpA